MLARGVKMLDAMLGRTGRKSVVKKKGRRDKMARGLACFDLRNSSFFRCSRLKDAIMHFYTLYFVEAMTMTIATDCFSKLRMRIGEYAYFV